MTNDKIIHLANSLSNRELADLLDLVQERLIVWTKRPDGVAVASNLRGVSLNGYSVQIILEDEDD